MGVTYVHAQLRRPDGRGPTRNVRFLVDSGAIYSVLPKETWRALRLRPERQVEFTLADGTAIERGVSECRFEIRGDAATSPVTGLWLAYHWLPDVSAWFSFEPGLSRDIFLKFVLLGATVLLAAHARLRIHPRLSPKNLGLLAIHVVAITILSLLFLMTGIAIRTGGWL